MKEIITDLSKLKTPCSPVEFLNKTDFNEPAVTECNEIISELKEVLSSRSDLVSLAAPQLGYSKRVFCLKFADEIKTFINPIVTKKSKDKFINFEKFVDLDSYVYVCRPTSEHVIFYEEGYKYGENDVKDEVAALFNLNTNLLDGIVAGEALNVDVDSLTELDIPAIIDATYSGCGIVVDRDTQLDLDDVAKTLSDYCDIFDRCVTDICDNEESSFTEDIKKTTRQFRRYERTALGDVTSLDGYQLRKNQRDLIQSERGERRAKFNKFVSTHRKKR